MASKNLVQGGRVQDARLDKLQDAGEIFGAAELQGQGDEVLSGHDPGGEVIEFWSSV